MSVLLIFTKVQIFVFSSMLWNISETYWVYAYLYFVHLTLIKLNLCVWLHWIFCWYCTWNGVL